jgi:hypothetical protein
MNYFFAPIISGLQTNITLNSYPPQGDAARYSEPMHVYLAWPDGGMWNLRNMGSLEPGRSAVYHLAEVLELHDKPILLYCLSVEALASRLDTLPVNDFMSGIVTWRANIQLASDTTAVSFQGEFPGEMLKVPKGSLTSIGPMVQGGEGVQTKIMLVNVKETADIEPHRLIVKKVVSGEVIVEAEVFTNTCNIIELGAVDAVATDPIGLFSPDMIGVPLYFTHDMEFSQMSFEHTHPPVTLTAFGRDRRDSVARMKGYWLSDL